MKLDTRSKILAPPRAAEFPGAVFVAMHLDPLTVSHARRLAELAAQGRPVVVLLSDPPDPLLPLQARAELAAALASVTAVIPVRSPGEAPAGVVPVVDEEPSDLERRAALVRHVLSKHAAAAV